VVGTVAERAWGHGWWLGFYLLGAVVGEVAGLAWKPVGAGSSVAVCGLLGSVAVWLLARVATWPGRFGAVVIVGGALLLTARHDLHGPPILAGALVAVLLVARRR